MIVQARASGHLVVAIKYFAHKSTMSPPDHRDRRPYFVPVLRDEPAGTTAAAPLADELGAAGIDCKFMGDAGEVGYIHGAIRSAWKVAVVG